MASRKKKPVPVELPKVFLYKGSIYEIIEKEEIRDDDGKPCCGTWDYDYTIEIETGLQPYEKRQALMHEIMEIFVSRNCLELPHPAIDSIAHFIVELFSDNPGLAEAIIGTRKAR